MAPYAGLCVVSIWKRSQIIGIKLAMRQLMFAGRRGKTNPSGRRRSVTARGG
jgi:hypothetical protein